MVLQAGSAQLFGSALPGEAITITYGGRIVSTKADGSGRWQATLTKLKSGENFSIVLVGKNTVTIKKCICGPGLVVFGTVKYGVWSGPRQRQRPGNSGCQSRSNQTIYGRPSAGKRAFGRCRRAVAHLYSGNSSSPSVPSGYFFGGALNKDQLKTQSVLYNRPWCGTPAQDWTSINGLAADPVTQSRYWLFAKRQQAHIVELSQAYDKTLAEWKATCEEKTHGQDKTPQPVKSIELRFPHTPSRLFNGMIAPLTHYTIGGVLWYQGESNAYAQDETMAYRRLLPALIKDWRKQFNLPELPFLYVQLANYDNKDDTTERSPWAELREAQLMTLTVPHTGMAVAIDIGDENDIHPRNKQDVGKRLERIALAQVYGKQEIFSGPIFTHLDIKGGKAICIFQHTDGGLKTRDGGKVIGFTICGPDKKFVAADAVVAGNTVVVSSPNVSQPMAVRYAWAGNPPNNLYNGAGLPASPFRSDLPAAPAIINLPVTK